MALKKNYLVEKTNMLNSIRANNLTLEEMRFFSIYLSRINPRDISTRVVRFSTEDFQKIMDIGRVHTDYLIKMTNSMLCKLVNIPSEQGGLIAFQLFKECKVEKDETGEWYVEIDAHDKALPLMFDFKDKYFTYELWNALILKSSNQLRMYEILKQYQSVGERTLTLSELRELLGIKKTEYPRYDNFKSKVLDSCKEALEINTDIKFTYEPVGKLGQGGKINMLRFKIFKNDNREKPILIDNLFSDKKTQNNKSEYMKYRIAYLRDACDKEFSDKEMFIIHDFLREIVPRDFSEDVTVHEQKLYEYLQLRYKELKWRATQTDIKNRFGYLRKMLEADIQINKE